MSYGTIENGGDHLDNSLKFVRDEYGLRGVVRTLIEWSSQREQQQACTEEARPYSVAVVSLIMISVKISQSVPLHKMEA